MKRRSIACQLSLLACLVLGALAFSCGGGGGGGGGVIPECSSNPDCGDSLFCNGVEVCTSGNCNDGADPCSGACIEATDTCVACVVNGDCDDGLFCNGVETCSLGNCTDPADACPGQVCNEATDTCTSVGFTPTFTSANPSPGVRTISMAPGTQVGDAFQVHIMVTGIDDFFGAAFRVSFNPAIATFTSFSNSGSFLGTGANTHFQAEAQGSSVLVEASRLGGVGVDVVATSRLITLNFQAVDDSAGSALSFGGAATREVQACPTLTTCNEVSDALLTWSGGTLVVTGP